MQIYKELQNKLKSDPRTWLVTGAAGFIGSHLVELLLKLNQRVVGIDNFSTGYPHNLEEVKSLVSSHQWNNFRFVEGDICELEECKSVMTWQEGTRKIAVDFVLHQAALGSVPRSIDDPIASNRSNVDGFLNVLVAARDAKVKGFVYAASSSTYGDDPGLPKIENKIGKPLSPYALTKLVNELYADVFSKNYGFDCVGLRYFNVFGSRQDPEGAYAAVIPKWIDSMVKGEKVYINGNGETSRDFCYVDNAVQANLLAATVEEKAAKNQVYNIALGDRTSLNQLFKIISECVEEHKKIKIEAPIYRDFRLGDVLHSLADINKAKKYLGYEPSHRLIDGIKESMAWYLA
jgi:UDP-N-acetylglucosamine 4-epimerase